MWQKSIKLAYGQPSTSIKVQYISTTFNFFLVYRVVFQMVHVLAWSASHVLLQHVYTGTFHFKSSWCLELDICKNTSICFSLFICYCNLEEFSYSSSFSSSSTRVCSSLRSRLWGLASSECKFRIPSLVNELLRMSATRNPTINPPKIHPARKSDLHSQSNITVHKSLFWSLDVGASSPIGWVELIREVQYHVQVFWDTLYVKVALTLLPFTSLNFITLRLLSCPRKHVRFNYKLALANDKINHITSFPRFVTLMGFQFLRDRWQTFFSSIFLQEFHVFVRTMINSGYSRINYPGIPPDYSHFIFKVPPCHFPFPCLVINKTSLWDSAPRWKLLHKFMNSAHANISSDAQT